MATTSRLRQCIQVAVTSNDHHSVLATWSEGKHCTADQLQNTDCHSVDVRVHLEVQHVGQRKHLGHSYKLLLLQRQTTDHCTLRTSIVIQCVALRSAIETSIARQRSASYAFDAVKKSLTPTPCFMVISYLLVVCTHIVRLHQMHEIRTIAANVPVPRTMVCLSVTLTPALCNSH